MKIVNGVYTSAKIFTDTIEDYALAQIKQLCDFEALKGCKVRIMPDVHAGKGCTIGTTMTITAANDINSLYNVRSNAVRNSLYDANTDGEGQQGGNLFGSILNAAVGNINNTNDLLSTQENEELKWMMGISENTHDLTMAVGKAQTALNYTIALRDKLLDAYKEIMQIQI